MIPDPVDCQQCGVHNQPLLPESECPEEGHPLKVAEEKWWVANRKKTASAITDEKNKEDECVDNSLSLVVRFEKRSHKKHRCTGCSDKARQQSTQCQEDGVCRRRRLHVTFYPNTTSDRVECKQESNKRHIFGQKCICKNGSRDCP